MSSEEHVPYQLRITGTMSSFAGGGYGSRGASIRTGRPPTLMNTIYSGASAERARCARQPWPRSSEKSPTCGTYWRASECAVPMRRGEGNGFPAHGKGSERREAA
jgi:hypothetical protein